MFFFVKDILFDIGSALSFVEILMQSKYVVTIPSSYQSNLLQARDGVRCPGCEPIPLFGSRSEKNKPGDNNRQCSCQTTLIKQDNTGGSGEQICIITL